MNLQVIVEKLAVLQASAPQCPPMHHLVFAAPNIAFGFVIGGQIQRPQTAAIRGTAGAAAALISCPATTASWFEAKED